MDMSKYVRQLKKELEYGGYPHSYSSITNKIENYRVDLAIDLIFKTISSMLDEKDPLFLHDISKQLGPALRGQSNYSPEEQLSFYISKEVRNFEKIYGIKKTKLKDCIRKIHKLDDKEKIKVTGSRPQKIILFKCEEKLLNRVRKGISLERIVIVKSKL